MYDKISLDIHAYESASARALFISLIDQVHYDLHHHILLFCLALCYHQSQGYKGVISQAFCAVWTIEYAVVV